ncbi:MAG TPA: NADH-quinone oxidoreductase subunit C [Dehalococcoidia bacterium]|nr:NADH-quinone oxidoreductase subunit C [Dehalococcoidia bacterium]
MPHPVTVTLPGLEVADRIRAKLPEAIRSVEAGWVVLEPAQAFEAMRVARDDEHLDGKFLVQLCSVDMITRIDVVYHLSSLSQNHIFEIKVPADHERPEVPSVSPLWIGAWLQEREVYDLMGVRFTGHPDLTRLFLWESFPGHPLRKDFMALPGGQKPGLSQFPKQVPGQTGQEFRPREPGTGG